jgi:hypothetical protein
MSEKLSEGDRALLNANPILGTTLWMLERGQEVILQPNDARTITTAFAALLNAARAEARPAPVVDDATGGPVPGPLTQEIVASIGLHHSTAALVNRFAHAMAEKLAKAEQKYGYSDGWARDDWQDECRRQLHHHAAKGDPRDVAAYAAFCWHHGWSTARPAPAVDREAVARIILECVIGAQTPECCDEAADDILALLSPATSPGEGSSSADRAARIASDHAASETLRKSDWVCNSCGAPFTSSGGKIIGGTCPNGRPTCPLVPA